MRGSVVKRGDGYSVVVELDRDPVTGKRRQKWHSGYRTKRDAERGLAELLGNVNRGTYVPRSRQTVSEYVEEWLAAIAPTVRPSTHYSYSRNLRLHVVPRIGSAPLVAVDAGTLNQLYAALLADGRKDYAGGGLAPRTVRYIHTILHRAFKDAVRWGGWPGILLTLPIPPRPERLAARSRSHGPLYSCARSSRERAAVGIGRRTSCWPQQDCDAAKRWGCAGLISTSMLAARRSDKP